MHAHSGDAGSRAAVEALAAIVDRLPLAASYVDAGGRHRYVNGRYAQWLGLPRPSILGRTLAEVLGDEADAAVRPHVESGLAGRETSMAPGVRLPAAIARWAKATFTPDVDSDGTVRGVVILALDPASGKEEASALEARVRGLEERLSQRAEVLERQARDLSESEDAREEREARLRAILDSAVDAIVMIDESGAIQSFNRAAERLFGYSEREVTGRNVSLLMPSPFRDEHDGYLGAYRRTQRARIIGIGREVAAQRKDGTVFPIHLSVGEARLGERRVFTGIIHDLTFRKRLEEQLAQAQKMEAVGRLAGGVAHDFNNVLLTILARTEAILRPGRKHPVREQALEIRKAARRAASLTKQLLAVSRRQVLNPRVVDLNAVLRDTAKMLRRLLGEEIRFRMDLAPDLAPVKVDPDQLVQVVLNLVVNARDAMPQGGDLVVESRDAARDEAGLANDAEAVLLAVRDTGSGMDDETRARIFEPYFTTKGDRGNGLGLSTVYGIVQQSGGDVRVESRKGEGSVFRIYFPRAEGRPQAPFDEAPPPARARERGAGHVLLVEDDSAARRALDEFLRSDGYTVLAAASGAEALRLCEGSKPIDLVVTDFVMPGMRGPELVKRLREARPGLPAVFMSGYATEDIGSQGDAARSVYLQKPFDVDDLLARVRAIVDEAAREPAGSGRAGRPPQPKAGSGPRDGRAGRRRRG
jgi:PAS domain S-box-containing protein